MNKILKNRIKLIRAMYNCNNIESSRIRSVIFHAISLIRTDNKELFLSISEDDSNRISYAKCPLDKLCERRRVKTSLQRFFRRQLEISSKDLSDAFLDEYANSVMEVLSTGLDSKVKLYKGDELSKFYAETRITSCMTGSCCNFKTSMYSLNPDKVQLVIFDKVLRAFLWTDDNGNKILDRIYPAQHRLIPMFRKWAKARGYYLRNNPDQITGDTNNGISSGKDHIITLKHDGLFPYVDTFKFGNFYYDKIVLSNNPKFGNVILMLIDGRLRPRKVCEICKGFVYRDSGVNTQLGSISVCQDCFDKIGFCCELCGENCLSSIENSKIYCKSCSTFAKGYVKHNNCLCYTCISTKKSFIDCIIQNKKYQKQLELF